MKRLKRLGTILILLMITGCKTVSFIPDIPDPLFIELNAPRIPQDSKSWDNPEFCEMVKYALALEVQITDYREYILNLNGGNKK